MRYLKTHLIEGNAAYYVGLLLHYHHRYMRSHSLELENYLCFHIDSEKIGINMPFQLCPFKPRLLSIHGLHKFYGLGLRHWRLILCFLCLMSWRGDKLHFIRSSQFIYYETYKDMYNTSLTSLLLAFDQYPVCLQSWLHQPEICVRAHTTTQDLDSEELCVERGSSLCTYSCCGVTSCSHLYRNTTTEWTSSCNPISAKPSHKYVKLTGGIVTSDHAHVVLACNCSSASLIGGNVGNEWLMKSVGDCCLRDMLFLQNPVLSLDFESSCQEH